MDSIIKNLQLDHWSRIIIAVSVAALGLALTFDVKGISNQSLLLIAVGGLLFGIGETINHPWHTHYVPATFFDPGLLGEGYRRKVSFIGVIFDVVGLLCVALGVYSIKSPQVPLLELLNI